MTKAIDAGMLRFGSAGLPPERRLVERLTEVATSALLVGLLVVGGIMVMRMGFPMHGRVYATALLWVAFMLFAPLALIRRLAATPASDAMLYAPCCMLSFAALMAVSYLGMAGTILLACATLAAMAELRGALIAALPSTPRRLGRWVFLLLAGLLLVLELSGSRNGSFIADIVAEYGRVNNDVYYHWSLTNALRWFGVTGIGVDGVVPVTYYHTVHLVAVRLAEAANAETGIAFMAMRHVFLPALTLAGFATMSLAMDRTGRLKGATALALVTILVLTGNLYILAFDGESFLLALMLLSWGAVALNDLGETPSADFRRRLVSWSSIIVILIAMGLTKSSICLIFLCLAGYTDLRQNWRRPLRLIGLGFLLLAIVGTLLYLVAPRGTITGVGGGIAENFRADEGLKPAMATYYATALFAICMSVIAASGGRAFLGKLVRGRLLQAELMFGCIAASTVPALLFVMLDGGAVNFTGVQVFWCAAAGVALLPAASEQLRNYAARGKPGRMPAVRFAGVLPYLVPIAMFLPISDNLARNNGNLAISASLLIRTQDMTYFVDDKKLLNKADARRGRPLLTQSAFWHPANTSTPAGALVHALQDLRHRYGQDLAAYASPDNKAFWNLKESCPGKSLLVFGLTSVPLIDGLPPLWTGCVFDLRRPLYGLETIPLRRSDAPLDDTALCNLAKERGFGLVYRIEDLNALDRNRLLTCS
ncbi:hypothetical protein [Dongia sedimenti]|uniref:Glycosyltransferase RgtA/B/C/D-like domain-containing protein n=1 Tax=Dongia sedimenti TaxID=3064282 RepID=A0ABU0YMK1_9PROT|nr:hypothetical protein [Rhodospirillaceae bacterium R-7]